MNLTDDYIAAVLASLHDAGLTVGGQETDGESFLDIYLDKMMAVSWRPDGWQVVEHDSDGARLRTWPLGKLTDPDEVAREAAAIVTKPVPNQPDDYWTQLAAELHTVADKLATLAGTPAPNGTTFLSMCASHAATQANWSRPIIDAFASAIGANPAQVKKIAGGWDYLAEMQLPSLRVQAYAAIPDPTETDKDARIRELEAQLAAKTEQAMSGGAR